MMEEKLGEELRRRGRRGKLRSLTPPAPANVLDLSTNDYLGLSRSHALRTEFQHRISLLDALGSTGSRLLSGNSDTVQALEQACRSFWNCEEALLVPSGWEANVSLFTCLPQSGDIVLYDALVHASVHQGLRASRCTRAAVSFKHNSVADLQRLLVMYGQDQGGGGGVIVAVETVYSMDGDVAPISEILECLRKTCPHARLIVDEAHATGVYGPLGRGLLAHHALGAAPELLARLHTFGKGAGATGAVILCSAVVKSYLLNYARGLIYATAISPVAAALAASSLHLLATGQTQVSQRELWDLIHHVAARLSRIPVAVDGKVPVQVQVPKALESAIVPILTRDPVRLSAFLEQRGFRVMAVRPPTVPVGKERIRLCLRAGVRREDIDRLIDCICDYASSLSRSCKL